MIARRIRARSPISQLARSAAFVSAALVLAAPAAAYPGDGRYPLPPLPSRELAGRLTDVASLTDGTVVVAEEGIRAWQLAPGAGRWRRIPGLAATGVTGLPDGRLLAIDALANRIVQWRPGGRVTPVAGTGREAPLGDGGPATAAGLALTAGFPQTVGLAAAPQGGFLFTDTFHNRVRHVDAAGIIRTVGVAAEPTGLSVLPDGGYAVTEAGGARRIRHAGADGVLRTIGRNRNGGDLVALPDGPVLVLESDDRPRWLTGSGPAFPGRDVAGRGLGCVQGGGAEGASLLLAACGSSIWWVARGAHARRAAAIRDVEVGRAGLRIVAEASAAGAVTLRVDGVAATTTETPGGHVALGRAGRLGAAWHRLAVSLDGGWSDGVDVWGGDRMTRRLARRLLRRSGLDGRGEGEDAWRVGRRCRAFGRRRVDCAVLHTVAGDRRCAFVASVALPRSGIPATRGYRCGKRRRAVFRTEPDWRPRRATTLTP